MMNIPPQKTRKTSLELDSILWDDVRSRLPGTSLTVIINTLGYHLLQSLSSTNTDVSERMRNAADEARAQLSGEL